MIGIWCGNRERFLHAVFFCSAAQHPLQEESSCLLLLLISRMHMPLHFSLPSSRLQLLGRLILLLTVHACLGRPRRRLPGEGLAARLATRAGEGLGHRGCVYRGGAGRHHGYAGEQLAKVAQPRQGAGENAADRSFITAYSSSAQRNLQRYLWLTRLRRYAIEKERTCLTLVTRRQTTTTSVAWAGTVASATQTPCTTASVGRLLCSCKNAAFYEIEGGESRCQRFKYGRLGDRLLACAMANSSRRSRLRRGLRVGPRRRAIAGCPGSMRVPAQPMGRAGRRGRGGNMLVFPFLFYVIICVDVYLYLYITIFIYIRSSKFNIFPKWKRHQNHFSKQEIISRHKMQHTRIYVYIFKITPEFEGY
jgi:hypothetical protein